MSQVWAEECAWHPKYIGHRKITFRVPIPEGMTPYEFGQLCEKEDRITHGICRECKPIMMAEVRAMKRQVNPGRSYFGRHRLMTLRMAKEMLRPHGMVIRRAEGGDWYVNFKGARESLAYYTDSLTDAVHTGLDMARRGYR